METREKIILAAMECFLQRDYKDVSLNEIAKKVNITKGGIYHYFSSKDSLLREVVIYSIVEMQKKLLSMTYSDTSLKEVVENLLSMGDMEADHALLLFTAIKKVPELKRDIAQSYQKTRDLLKEKIIQGQKNDEVRKDIAPKVLACELSLLIEGCLDQRMFDASIDVKKMCKRVFTDLWKRIKI